MQLQKILTSKMAIISFLIAVANCSLIHLCSKGFLGATPLSLPIAFVLINFCLALYSGVIAFKNYKRQKPYSFAALLAVAVYLGLIFFNIGALKEIMYVS